MAEFPYPIVETAWLADNIDAVGLRVIDASWRMPGAGEAICVYRKQRIPRAVFFDIDKISGQSRALPHMLPKPSDFAKAVGNLGIANRDRVVVYDDAGIFSAPRVWWTFRAMGHAQVSVLNGGFPKWMRENRPIETGAPPLTDSRIFRAALQSECVFNAAEVASGLRTGALLVIDARPSPRFEGRQPEPRPGLASGHMPGAVSVPFTEIIDENGEIQSPLRLQRLFDARKIDKQSTIATSCGSGVTAAILSIALESIGYRDHALYDGSWTEWGAAENDREIYPITTGAYKTWDEK